MQLEAKHATEKLTLIVLYQQSQAPAWLQANSRAAQQLAVHFHIRNVFQTACAAQQAPPQLLGPVGWLFCLLSKLIQLVKGRSQECLTCISSSNETFGQGGLVLLGAGVLAHTAFSCCNRDLRPLIKQHVHACAAHLVVVWRLAVHHAL